MFQHALLVVPCAATIHHQWRPCYVWMEPVTKAHGSSWRMEWSPVELAPTSTTVTTACWTMGDRQQCVWTSNVTLAMASPKPETASVGLHSCWWNTFMISIVLVVTMISYNRHVLKKICIILILYAFPQKKLYFLCAEESVLITINSIVVIDEYLQDVRLAVQCVTLMMMEAPLVHPARPAGSLKAQAYVNVSIIHATTARYIN